ncbi:hypothetical protein CWI38_0251p0010 [Hamiltosporidium tvaerminnensis]|uniref:Uncharacterized protein n=1 Tax=Hamiltosporidium tvaerminnensis TaxID=1176355 RepID=A0A4Q9LYZ5_9MICR|nr:hypothetical protein CWI38_0251p0010 [Hamiltosporidium tvaerminnensis]
MLLGFILLLLFGLSSNASFIESEDENIDVETIENTDISEWKPMCIPNTENTMERFDGSFASKKSIKDIHSRRLKNDMPLREKIKFRLDEVLKDFELHYEYLTISNIERYTYILSKYEYQVYCSFEVLKKNLYENKKTTAFSFKYMHEEILTDFVDVENLYLNIKKCSILINKIYRFFLLENEQFGSLESIYMEQDNQNPDFILTLFTDLEFANIICQMNKEVEKLNSGENFEHDYKKLKLEYRDCEAKICVYSVNPVSPLFCLPDWDRLYSSNFITNWKKTILEILDKKNNYIFFILPEFISFEFRLKEELDSIRLKNGDYFKAILNLKLLLNNPIVDKIQQRYNNQESKNEDKFNHHEERRWYLKKKQHLKKCFMKVIKIFVLSIEHNLIYSLMYTLEKTIYYGFVGNRLGDNSLFYYHKLNILNDVIFLMNENLIKSIFLNLDAMMICILHKLPSVAKKKRYTDNFFQNFDETVKRSILHLYIRLSEYIIKIGTIKKICGGKYEFIVFQFEAIKIFLEGSEETCILNSKKSGYEKEFKIDELLQFSACCLQQILGLSFHRTCFHNLRNWFKGFFSR